VAVGKDRVQAARLLLAESGCDCILADDGLQHYALGRDVEIVVIDGQRRFGNGFCLPAGPLREPIERIRDADFIVVNGVPEEPDEIAMSLLGDTAVNLLTGECRALSAFSGNACHAVAGIGNPQRFFQHLADVGVGCRTHAFFDHYAFTSDDIKFDEDAPVLMTEKDAVKCIGFAQGHHWYVPVTAKLADGFVEVFLNKLRTCQIGSGTY
jgi:tetraacyldisaccharide 4'-kinase